MDYKTLLVSLVVSIIVSAVIGYLASYAAIMHASLNIAADLASKEAKVISEIDKHAEATKKELLNYTEMLKAVVKEAGGESVEVNVTRIPLKTESFDVYIHMNKASYRYTLWPYLNVTVTVKVNHIVAGEFKYDLPTVFVDYDFKAGTITYKGPWGIKIIEVSVELSGYKFYGGDFYTTSFEEGKNIHIYIYPDKEYSEMVEVKLEKAP